MVRIKWTSEAEQWLQDIYLYIARKNRAAAKRVVHWLAVSSIFSIQNEEQYDRAVEVLNALLDEVETNEQHPLYGMLDTLGTVMYAYE